MVTRKHHPKVPKETVCSSSCLQESSDCDEVIRLRKVIDAKDVEIASLTAHDSECKEYYKGVLEENAEIRESFKLFTEELMKVVDDGDISQSDYSKFMKLYANWYSYKKTAEAYKDSVSEARKSIRDIRDDVRKLQTSVRSLDMNGISKVEAVIDRMVVMQQHLAFLESRLYFVSPVMFS